MPSLCLFRRRCRRRPLFSLLLLLRVFIYFLNRYRCHARAHSCNTEHFRFFFFFHLFFFIYLKSCDNVMLCAVRQRYPIYAEYTTNQSIRILIKPPLAISFVWFSVLVFFRVAFFSYDFICHKMSFVTHVVHHSNQIEQTNVGVVVEVVPTGR